MPPELKPINEILTCPNLNESVRISAIQKTQRRKTWIATFECDHYMSCPTIRVSDNSFNYESCPLFVIFKRRG